MSNTPSPSACASMVLRRSAIVSHDHRKGCVTHRLANRTTLGCFGLNRPLSSRFSSDWRFRDRAVMISLVGLFLGSVIVSIESEQEEILRAGVPRRISMLASVKCARSSTLRSIMNFKCFTGSRPGSFPAVEICSTIPTPDRYISIDETR